MKLKKIHSLISIPLLLTASHIVAKPIDNVAISLEQVTKDVHYLASDSLQGRANYSKELEQAASYIAQRFKESGLSPYQSDMTEVKNYLQTFDLNEFKLDKISLKLNDVDVNEQEIAVVSTLPKTDWTFSKAQPNHSIKLHSIAKDDDFITVIRSINAQGGEHFVTVSRAHQDMFSRYKAYFSRGITKLATNEKANGLGGTIVMVLADDTITVDSVQVTASTQISQKHLANVVGVLPGTTHPEEIVLFSAHYDHIGVKSGAHDSSSDIIYNGADDDASGTSAVMNLAQYYANKGNNKRTLMFVTFSAEEIGGYGSQYFSKQVNPETITAMINIEMIGKPSKFGVGTLWMTGFERSTLGELLNKELAPYNMEIHVDPYPKQGLFYRSDNATLARQGVPAHSFSSTQLDKDQHYHNVSDDISSLDFNSLHLVVKSLAVATQPLVDAKITPSRIDKNTINNKGKIY
jgi:hypothetical protein